MKKALFSAAVMFVFSVTMLLGTTYAWWSEEIVVDENIIQMGELDLTVELADPKEWVDGNAFLMEKWYDLQKDYPTTGIFETTNTIEPGSYDYRLVKLTNDGTIPLAYRVKNEITVENELVENINFYVVDVTELYEYLDGNEFYLPWALSYGDTLDKIEGALDESVIKNNMIHHGPIANMTSDFVYLNPEESHVYLVLYIVNEELGNVGQNQTLPFTLTFDVQQTAKAAQLERNQAQ